MELAAAVVKESAAAVVVAATEAMAAATEAMAGTAEVVVGTAGKYCMFHRKVQIEAVASRPTNRHRSPRSSVH